MAEEERRPDRGEGLQLVLLAASTMQQGAAVQMRSPPTDRPMAGRVQPPGQARVTARQPDHVAATVAQTPPELVILPSPNALNPD